MILHQCQETEKKCENNNWNTFIKMGHIEKTSTKYKKKIGCQHLYEGTSAWK